MNVTFYDAIGRIRFVVPFDVEPGESEPNEAQLANYLQPGGGYALERADLRRDYYLDGVRTRRPVLDVQEQYRLPADGVTEVTIPLPAGTGIVCTTIPGLIASSDGEPLVFATDQPGEDEFVLLPPFPWIGVTIRIIADAVSP